MKTPFTVGRLSLLAAVFALLALVSTAANAQTNNLQISNNTNCTVRVCDPNGLFCIDLAPGESRAVTIACSGVIGVRMCGVIRQVGPGHQNFTAVDLGAGCCGDVAYSPGFVPCTWFLSFSPSASRCVC